MSSEWKLLCKPSLIPVLKFAHRIEQLPSRSFLPLTQLVQVQKSKLECEVGSDLIILALGISAKPFQWCTKFQTVNCSSEHCVRGGDDQRALSKDWLTAAGSLQQGFRYRVNIKWQTVWMYMDLYTGHESSNTL